MFRRGPKNAPAADLYLAVVEQARRPEFYNALGVPDTLDGRFELIVLHAFIVLNRLRKIGDEGAQIGQLLFDQMFADMDRNLREMGVGDLSVGKQVKRMAQRFYGSVHAYEDGLAEADGSQLQAALERNIYGLSGPARTRVTALSGYLRREVEAAAEIDDAELLAGRIRFGSLPDPAG
jgi:cytochrome b pre-mRNA-processing protein 3